MSIIKSFSVGDGDMFYIDHNSDNFSIIDCCMDDGNKEAITQEIKDKISKKGIIRFISTHPDEDHLQGLKYLDEQIGIDMTMTLADIISCTLSFGALIAALYIGVIQNRINRRMLSIQDGVDIYLRTKYLMDKDDPSKMIAAQIEIRNISATPLSLERYVFNGVERVISPYRLPPAVQFPDAYYYINLPSVNHMDYASFTLHFEDTTQRKWRVPGRAEFKSGTWELSWEKPQKI